MPMRSGTSSSVARLKFDLKPLTRDEDKWHTREENDAWVREIWGKWERDSDPMPCDCGFWDDGWLVTCDARQRRDCHKHVQRRLENHYRCEHQRGLRKKREFPGPPHDGKGRGWCRWCGAEILNPKTGELHKTRTWCAHGRCLKAYRLHTDHNSQRHHLIQRDGAGCKECGSEERCEVDHFIALAVAWEVFRDDLRWRWFFSPAQLRLLCGRCHAKKTVQDVALMKAIRRRGVEWGRSEILRLLADEGLLRGASPKRTVP